MVSRAQGDEAGGDDTNGKDIDKKWKTYREATEGRRNSLSDEATCLLADRIADGHTWVGFVQRAAARETIVSNYELTVSVISPTSIPQRNASWLMLAAVVLVSLAAVPTIKLVVPLGNLSGFTLDWLLTFMALAIFRAAVPGAFPSDLRWRLPTVRQWGLVLLLFAASVATWFLIRIVFPDAAFCVRRSYWPTVIPSVAGLSPELMLRLVGAPVLEEVFYRGFLLGELRRTMRPRWAVIAQGVIFGLSHYLRGPYSVALCTVTGVLFGLPRLFGVGIVPMILAHSLLNFILGAPFFFCVAPRELAARPFDALPGARGDEVRTHGKGSADHH